MHKAIIAGALSFLLLLGLGIWASITAINWLGSQLPGLAENGRQVAWAAAQEGKRLLPGLAEQARSLSPELWDRAREWLDAAPTAAGSAQDVAGVLRHPALQRVAAAITEGRSSAAYEGPGTVREVSEFYRGALLAVGFHEAAHSSGDGREAWLFQRPGQRLSVVVGPIGGGRVRVDVAEL